MPFLRSVLFALVCAGVSGCQIMVAADIDQMMWAAETNRCREFAAKGIAAVESIDIPIPANEREAQRFEAVLWWGPAFERAGSPHQLEQSGTPAKGTLVVTDKSLYLVPPPGTAGVLIPYEVVKAVDLSPINPHSLIVRTLCHRFDIFAFWQRQADKFDPEAAAVAATQLKARVAAYQATADRVVKPR